MDRALDSCSSAFKPLVMEVLARLIERQVLVLIVQTGRTFEEQAVNVQKGVSATMRSKHLPRKLRGIVEGTADDLKCDAIDLCPYDVYQLHGADKLAWAVDASTHQAWDHIRDLGELLGLRSGARWKTPFDPGHLELLLPGERYPDIPSTSAAYGSHGVHA